MSEPAEMRADTQFEFITFSAGGQNYCLEITQIREIRRWTPVTALPHTPKDVLGVMNLLWIAAIPASFALRTSERRGDR